MAKFNPTDRILLEGSQTNINRQVAAELQKLDKKAAEIREKGGSPALDMSADILALKTATARLSIETVQAIDNEIAELRDKWITDRDRRPERETAQLLRARNRISALSDDEAAKLADSYLENGDLDLYEINELSSRLRSAGLGAELDGLHRAAKYHRGLEPWLQNEAAAELVDYRESLQSIKAGQLIFENKAEDVRISMDVDSLVDFHGELDE